VGRRFFSPRSLPQTQTSADVSNVAKFGLPDPAGKAGGACTSVLLNILYKDHAKPDHDMSFVEVLEQMRATLEKQGYSQIPQLSSTLPIDVKQTFDLVPASATGTRRAILIGIKYVRDDCGTLWILRTQPDLFSCCFVV
jgi:metacaspase-1